MRATAWMAAFGIMALMAAGCGRSDPAIAESPHEKNAQELLSGMVELNDVLDGVTDEASAKAAQPRMAAAAQRIETALHNIEAAGEPSEAEERELEAKFGPALDEQAQKWQAHFIRIAADPALAEALSDAMDKAMGGAEAEGE